MLTETQNDALREVVNIGVGRAAASLSDLIQHRIELTVPKVVCCTAGELANYLQADDDRLDTAVVQDFTGSVSGRALLAFPRASGQKLAQLIEGTEEVPDAIDMDLSGILCEVGNIVLNGVLGSVSNLLSSNLTYTVPSLSIGEPIERMVGASGNQDAPGEPTILYADTHFKVAENNISGSLVVVFELGSVDVILDAVLSKEKAW